MTKAGKKLIKAAKDAVALAKGKADPASYKVHEVLTRAPEMALSVQFDTVKIEIPCRSAYEAQTLFDDLTARLRAGQSITIKPQAH